MRRRNRQGWDARRVIHTFSPSAVVLVLVIAVSGGLQQSLPRVDFGMFYSTAMLLKQDPRNLYNPDIQTEFLHAATGLHGEAHYLPFAYPPFVSLLFIPMASMPFMTAYYLMFAANLCILAFTLWLLSLRLKLGKDQLIGLLVAASGALPLYAVLFLGHLTFLGMLFLSLFITDLMADRKTRAGFWAGLMLFKPILVPVPLLILLWKKQWRALASFSATALVLLSLSLLLVGWGGLLANIAMMRAMTSEYLLPRTHSLRGLAFFMHIGPAGWIVLSLAVVTALWLAVARAPNQRWVAAGIAPAVMLVTPYLQYHDLALGLVGIAVVLTAINPVLDKTRNIMFLSILVPTAAVLIGPRNQQIFPIMPLILTVFFVYCLWKSFRPTQKLDMLD